MTDIAGPPTAPSVGGILAGRYRLDAVLGRGGYATVYRAHDEHLGRDVAVKVFAAGAADAAGSVDADRVVSETRLLASVGHPSLVTLHDAHLDARPPFLVLELVDGPTLGDLIAAGALAPPRVARIAAELTEALHVIHARGIVHRDVKPSNVLMRPGLLPDSESRATLADFGIAALVDSARVTATGTFVGTAAYLSPEQVRGEQAGPAADVYALGLVLLESLTGVRAFPQPTPHEALVARLVRSPEIPVTLPAAWRTLLSAMTADDPAQRPDAHAVLRAIQRLDEAPGALPPATDADGDTGEATLALPEPTRVYDLPGDDAYSHTADASAPAPSRRRRRIVVAAVVALLALVILLAVVVGLTAAGTAPADPAPTLPPLPEPLGEHLRQLLDEVRS